MAQGLKGQAIAYTNISDGVKTMTISGAAKFSVWAKVDTIDVWTQSQEDAGPINGQLSFKQTFDTDTPFSSDAFSRQLSSDVFEDIKIEIPNGAKVHGFIWGQGATWVVA